ncbi:MAG: hypothetical protein MHPSP_004690, partial [Paramarteilia canceri]
VDCCSSLILLKQPTTTRIYLLEIDNSPQVVAIPHMVTELGLYSTSKDLNMNYNKYQHCLWNITGTLSLEAMILDITIELSRITPSSGFVSPR